MNFWKTKKKISKCGEDYEHEQMFFSFFISTKIAISSSPLLSYPINVLGIQFFFELLIQLLLTKELRLLPKIPKDQNLDILQTSLYRHPG